MFVLNFIFFGKIGDIEWNFKNTFFLPALSSGIGIGSGFLGIGGGLIAGPLLLALDLVPQVSIATSGFMTLFTSSSTTTQFLILGRIDPTIAIWYGSLGFISGYLGNRFVGELVKKYKKQSYVSFIVSISIVLSTIAMIIVQLAQYMDHIRNPKKVKFHSACVTE
jgi:uncharacterized membrane protein YfcA